MTSMGIRIRQKGTFEKIESFLKGAKKVDPIPVLRRYGEVGVEELAKATPIDTGLTAASWYYEIEKTKEGYALRWNNRNVVNGVNIALIIQLGHGTRGNTYVQGRDYINPALEKVFDDISDNIWKEVTN